MRVLFLSLLVLPFTSTAFPTLLTRQSSPALPSVIDAVSKFATLNERTETYAGGYTQAEDMNVAWRAALNAVKYASDQILRSAIYRNDVQTISSQAQLLLSQISSVADDVEDKKARIVADANPEAAYALLDRTYTEAQNFRAAVVRRLPQLTSVFKASVFQSITTARDSYRGVKSPSQPQYVGYQPNWAYEDPQVYVPPNGQTQPQQQQQQQQQQQGPVPNPQSPNYVPYTPGPFRPTTNQPQYAQPQYTQSQYSQPQYSQPASFPGGGSVLTGAQTIQVGSVARPNKA